MRKLPPGSTLHSIIYLAFQEYYLYLAAFDRNIDEAKAFLRDEGVREESIKVYQNSFEKQRVIKRVSDYWPHNVAAWWFLTLDMPTLVRQETKNWALLYPIPMVYLL